MRDLMVLGFMALVLPLTLRSTCVAYLMWGWSSVIAINLYVYGFMASVQLNMMFALIALTMIALGKDPLKRPFEANRTTTLYMLFAAHGLIAATLAYDVVYRNWEIYINLIKGMLFCFLMPMVITTRARIYALVFVVATGLSFHGFLDGLKFVKSAGGHISAGLAKFGDNNHFAVVMAMCGPLLLYLAQYSSRKWVKIAFAGALVVNVLSVISTRSRGGLVCIVAMGVAIALNSRRKGLALSLIACAVLGISLLAGAEWSERMNSMKDAGADGSFMGRVAAWKRSTAIAVEHPLVGGGFHAVQESRLYWKFANSEGLLGFIKTPPPDGIAFAAHSIYFEVLGDQGFPGFILFMLILANALVTRMEIRHLVPRGATELYWARDLADMIVCSLIAYMVGGALVSLAYVEVAYVIIMLLEVLKREVRLRVAKPPVPSLNARMSVPARGGLV